MMPKGMPGCEKSLNLGAKYGGQKFFGKTSDLGREIRKIPFSQKYTRVLGLTFFECLLT